MVAESEMKPATASGRAAMIGRCMARGRRVGVMPESRSEQGGDGRRRSTGGSVREWRREGPPHDARLPGRGDRSADARTTREAVGLVKKPADRAGVGVEAHGVDGGGGRRKPDHIDRKTKK